MRPKGSTPPRPGHSTHSVTAQSRGGLPSASDPARGRGAGAEGRAASWAPGPAPCPPRRAAPGPAYPEPRRLAAVEPQRRVAAPPQRGDGGRAVAQHEAEAERPQHRRERGQEQPRVSHLPAGRRRGSARPSRSRPPRSPPAAPSSPPGRDPPPDSKAPPARPGPAAPQRGGRWLPRAQQGPGLVFRCHGTARSQPRVPGRAGPRAS